MKITLTYKLLRHDIDQKTWRMAESFIEDEKKRAEAQAEDSASDNAYYLRLMQEGIAYLTALISDELTKVTEDKTDELLQDNISEGTWAFQFKDTITNVDPKAVADIMHALVVAYAVGVWAGDHVPNAATAMSSDLQAMGTSLLNALYSLDAPVKNRRTVETDDVEITVE